MEEVRLGSRTLQPGRQLLARGERVPLGKRALDILSMLAEARGEIVTKDELLDAVWPAVTVEENALQVHVTALRKALGPEAERLKTIRSVGYQLDVDGRAADGSAPDTPSSVQDAPLPRMAAPPPLALPTGRSKSWSEKLLQFRMPVVLAALVALLLALWAMVNPTLGPRSGDRIPVVVHGLTASAAGGPAESALASGITDELILRLRRIGDLKVATAEPDGTAPGGEFDDAYVVSGNLRSNGNHLRVTVRLAETGGEILWSQTLDRAMSDLFDLQEEIAAAIAGELSVSLDVGANSSDYGGTDNPEAFAAYMQYYIHQWGPEQDLATRYLERAVALDPNFVKGLVGLSQNYASRASLVTTAAEAEAALAKMDDSSARALKAAPDLAIANAIRGWFMLMRKDVVEADRLMARARELDRGNDPELRTSLAIYAIYTGRAEEGAAIRQSNELIDPIYGNDPWKIFDFMILGRYREAVELFAKLRRKDSPGLTAFQFHAYMSYLLMGDEAGAAEFAKSESLPFSADLQAAASNSELATMSDAELKRWAESFGGPTLMMVAAVYTGYAGHPTQAAKILRWAMERPGGSQMLLMWHPALAQARKTAGFEKLVIDIGLAEAWRESGDWGDFCRPVSAREIECT